MTIKNLGNTCYLDSVLQCLFHTKSIQRYIKVAKNKDPVSNAFANLMREVLRGCEGNPEVFYRFVKDAHSDFDNNCHHDAHEALMVILEMLSKSFDRISNTMFRSKSQRALLVWGEKYNIIDEIFRVMYRCVYRCKACGHEQTTYDTDYCVYDNAIDTEQLEHYRCDRCKTVNKTVRKQTVSHNPQTLITVHKKDLPEEEFIFGNSVYKTFAIVSHVKFNEMTGHYNAHVLENGEWLLKDNMDLKVKFKPVISFAEIQK
jgi:ubiquitin C-terminal hydrolase